VEAKKYSTASTSLVVTGRSLGPNSVRTRKYKAETEFFLKPYKYAPKDAVTDPQTYIRKYKLIFVPIYFIQINLIPV